MGTIEKRDFIHSHLHEVNERLIDEVYEKMVSFLDKEGYLTKEQEEELNKRVTRHKKGKSKSYSWPEAKERIRSRL